MRYFLVKGIFSIILLTMLTSAVLFFCLVKNSADKNCGVSNKYADVSALNAGYAVSAGALSKGKVTFPQDKADKADAEIRFRSVGNAYRGGVGSKKQALRSERGTELSSGIIPPISALEAATSKKNSLSPKRSENWVSMQRSRCITCSLHSRQKWLK